MIMRTPLLLTLSATLLLAGCQTTPARSAAFTAVPGFGKAFAAPDADMQVDQSLRYRVVFPATRAGATPRDTVPALERAARFLNLLGAAGRRTAPGDIIVVISGPATTAVLTDTAWLARHPDSIAGNPNLPLIRGLREAGAVVSVCSQALRGQKVAAADVDPAVRQDLSAITTIAALEADGYALIPE